MGEPRAAAPSSASFPSPSTAGRAGRARCGSRSCPTFTPARMPADMARLSAIVSETLAHRPDLALLGGDFVNMQLFGGGRVPPRDDRRHSRRPAGAARMLRGARQPRLQLWCGGCAVGTGGAWHRRPHGRDARFAIRGQGVRSCRRARRQTLPGADPRRCWLDCRGSGPPSCSPTIHTGSRICPMVRI